MAVRLSGGTPLRELVPFSMFFRETTKRSLLVVQERFPGDSLLLEKQISFPSGDRAMPPPPREKAGES